MEYLDNLITRLAQKCIGVSPGDSDDLITVTADSTLITVDSTLITSDETI
jgi:hypothetical protein